MTPEPSSQPIVRWPIPGQAALFDPTDYHRPHTEWPFLDPSLVSDDQLHEWRHNPDRTDHAGHDAGSVFGPVQMWGHS